MADKKDDKKKTAEPAAAAGDEAPPKKKSKILMLVLVAAGALALIGGSVGATLYFTGFFSSKPVETAKQAGDEHGVKSQFQEQHGEGGGDHSGEEAAPEAGGGEEKDSAEVPEAERFAATYKSVERDFTMNVPNSKKFVQFKVAYKTFYGEKIVERVVKHQIAIEAAMLAAAAQFSEEELLSLDGRARVAGALRDAMNDVLIRNEDFGGIEEVMFTHFVFQ
jgi:flagellar FliL protein